MEPSAPDEPNTSAVFFVVVVVVVCAVGGGCEVVVVATCRFVDSVDSKRRTIQDIVLCLARA